MMSNIRKHMKSRVVQIFVWVTLFSLIGGLSILPILKNLFFKKEVDGVATVNGYTISINEFRRTLSPIIHLMRQIRSQYGEQAPLILSLWGLDPTKKPEEIVLKNLIEDKVLLNASNKIGAKIGKEYLESKLKDPYFVQNYLADFVPQQVYQDGVLNTELLVHYLQRVGISEEEFENILYRLLERNLLQQIVLGGLYIPQVELKNRYMQSFAKKKYAIITFDMNRYINKAKSEKLTDSQIEAYFKSHQDFYKVPEKRFGTTWEFRPENYGIIVTDKEVKDYYDKHKNEFITKYGEREIRRIVIKIDSKNPEADARKKIYEIYQKVKEKPELFDRVAQEESQASEKGQVIHVKMGDKERTELEQTAFELEAVGAISSPIRTSEGFEIIKLTNKKPAEYKKLEDVKQDIIKKVVEEKFKTSFATDARRILSQASDMPTIFDNFIKNKQAHKSDVGPFDKTESPVAGKLFNMSQIGERSFYQEGDNGYILQLNKIEKSFIPQLTDLKDKVIEDIYKEKAENALKKDLKNAVISTKDSEQISREMQGKLEKTDWIDPKNEETMKIFKDKKIPMQMLSRMVQLKERIEYLTPEYGYIVQLTDVEPFDKEKFEENRNKIKLELLQLQLQNVFGNFAKWLESKAKVEVNNTLLKRASVGL